MIHVVTCCSYVNECDKSEITAVVPATYTRIFTYFFNCQICRYAATHAGQDYLFATLRGTTE